MRSTVLKHQGVPVLPPIQVTIVAGENDISLRISDQGQYSRTLYLYQFQEH